MRKIVTVILIIIAILYLIDKIRFPVTYEVCFYSSAGCTTVAQFKDETLCRGIDKAVENSSTTEYVGICKFKPF